MMFGLALRMVNLPGSGYPSNAGILSCLPDSATSTVCIEEDDPNRRVKLPMSS